MVDNFIRTIRNHMHPRWVAFLTASLQSGMGVHVCVKERDWWRQGFANVGLFGRQDEAQLTRRIGQSHAFNWSSSMSNMFVLEVRN